MFILVLGLAATVLLAPGTGIREVAGLPNFTIPTRTPVPPPTTKPPTAQPPPPGNTPPPATATNSPLATATIIPVTLAASPVGGYLPTAEACGAPPTVQTRNNTWVRSGPGLDYATSGNLVPLEVRLIVGRAGHAPWWLIELPNGETGWVANEVVTVRGYIGDVPIVNAPTNEGETLTPGALWQPTAVPACPTSTATSAAALVQATNTATAQPTDTHTAVPTATTAATATETATEPTATATSVVPAGAGTVEALAASSSAQEPEATAVPLDDSTSGSVASLPCASAIIGVAIAAFFVSRRFW